MSMAIQQPTWRIVMLTTLGAIVAMVALSISQSLADAHYAWSSEVEHATGHAALGVPLLFLVVAAARLWPPPRPTRMARRARRVIVAGIATITLGQFLEVLGAFAFDGDERRWPTLAAAHDVGLIVGPFGLLMIGGGVALALHRPSAALGAADLAILGIGVIGIAGLFVGLPPIVGALLIMAAIAVIVGRRLRARVTSS